MSEERTEHGKEIMKYDQIDENITIGTNQCCVMHFEKDLLDRGITADISLEEKRVDAPFGVESYLWLPTVDHTPPSQNQLMLGTEHLTKLVEEHQKVYVHCKNGHGRAPTLVAAYYISTGMSVEEAIKYIHDKRKGSHINDVQKDALNTFAKNY